MLKKILSMMVIAAILIATGNECFAGGRSRSYGRRRSSGVSISDFGKGVLYVTGAIATIKVIDRILGTDQQAVYPGGGYPQGGYYASPAPVMQQCYGTVEEPVWTRDRFGNPYVSGVNKYRVQIPCP